MTTFKITLAYDGTDFVGWQRQASGMSIQGLLEDVLRELDQRDVAVIGAGRTDAGVHALGQVAGFTLNRSIDGNTVQRVLNARLPGSVRVVTVDEVAASFHARFGATRKLYRYRIWNGVLMSPFERAYAWHVPGPLDTDAMQAAAALIEGRRDFSAFQAAGSSTRTCEREVFSSMVLIHHDVAPRTAWRSPSHPGASDRPDQPEQPILSDQPDPPHRPVQASPSHGALIEYEVIGSGFLRHMVRNIVGSLVEIGRGRRSVDWIATVIEGRDRTRSGPTAPPHGLVLVAVEYGVKR